MEEGDVEAFLQDFCANVDATPEECLGDIEYAKACFPNALAEYLEEHPECTGIEYNGEMHTAEELYSIATDQIEAAFSEEAEAGTEETESEEQ